MFNIGRPKDGCLHSSLHVLTVMLFFVSLAQYPAHLAAQRGQPFETGEYLRITAREFGLEEQVARFLRLYRDTLTVQADSELSLPVTAVTRLEVSRGYDNRPTLVGIAAGAFAGVLVGIAIAPSGESTLASGTLNDPPDRQPINSTNDNGSHILSGAAVGPLAGAFVGGFVGGAVGKALRKHRWEEVPLERLRGGGAS